MQKLYIKTLQYIKIRKNTTIITIVFSMLADMSERAGLCLLGTKQSETGSYYLNIECEMLSYIFCCATFCYGVLE